MRLALSGGGTGGHVYPALSIAQAVERELPSGETLDLLYLGSSGGAESDIVQRAGLALRSITAAPIRGRMPWEMARTRVRSQSARGRPGASSEFKPQVVLSTAVTPIPGGPGGVLAASRSPCTC
jgi:UDP-N-acetylglucosamine--N-acetylmuramyl-(pentapeptide) pyrophosphoryl-undecaprenol N-acetylglucosamine transferase